MKSKVFFTFIFLLILTGFTYAFTAYKNSLQAAQSDPQKIGTDAAQIVVDEETHAIRIRIDGHEKVRINDEGIHVINGGYFHGGASAKTNDAQGGRP